VPYIYGGTAPGIPPLHLGSPKATFSQGHRFTGSPDHRLTEPPGSQAHRLTGA